MGQYFPLSKTILSIYKGFPLETLGSLKASWPPAVSIDRGQLICQTPRPRTISLLGSWGLINVCRMSKLDETTED